MLIKIKAKQAGGHIHFGMWMGKHEGALGKAGELCLREEEWQVLRESLQASSPGNWQQDGMILRRTIKSPELTIIIEEHYDDKAAAE